MPNDVPSLDPLVGRASSPDGDAGLLAGLPAGGGIGGEGGHWLNAERVRVYSWMVVVIFAGLFAVWLCRSLPGLVDPEGKPFGYDFMAYWSAARLSLSGHAAAAYDEGTIAAVQHAAAVHAQRGIIYPWHYPPTFLLPIAPLGLLPYPAALALFVLLTALPWAALVGRVLPDRRAWIVAAAAPAGLITLLDGQNAFLTASLAGFALLWLDRRPTLAGVLIGLLAIKPQLAMLFPVALLAEGGRWRSIVAAAVTVAALCLASLAVFGAAPWAAFLHHLPVSEAMGDSGAVPWRTMPTAEVFLLSLGAPFPAARTLQTAVALIAAGCVWRAWRDPAVPFEAKAATLLAASLSVSPYLFYYDLLWAALAIGWLARLALRDGFRRGEREIFLFAYSAPALIPPVQIVTGVQLGFPAVLLLLVAAVQRAAPLTNRERNRLRRVVDVLRCADWLNAERAMRWGCSFAILSLLLIGVHILTHTTHGYTDGRGDELGNDFINFWSGAHLAAAGHAALAYQPPLFQAFEQVLTGPSSSYRIYAYPPVMMLLSLPLALFSFVPGLVLWTALGAAACFGLLRRLCGWRLAAVATIGAPAAFFDLVSGQNGHFTAALLAGGLMLLDRRPTLAGICFGCFAYKPQMAVLLPFALAAGGYWRAFAAAAVTAGALVLASLALVGAAAWLGFIAESGLQSHLLTTYANAWHRMPTVFVGLRVMGAAPAVAFAAQMVSAGLAIAAVVAVWRTGGRAPFGVKAAVLLIATFLATPYAFDYDETVLVFAAAWWVREAVAAGTRFRPWEKLSLAALLVATLPAMILTKLIGVSVAPVILWLAMIALVVRTDARASVSRCTAAVAAWRSGMRAARALGP